MDHKVQVYNTYTNKLETLQPLNPPYLGLYVCGPTVYGHPHLGHARSAVTFDVIVRYLRHLGYKVRYVRNITDVGHLLGDVDEGEDKVGKQAKLAQISPMEVAAQYTDSYHQDMAQLNVLPPSIAPRATGHIIAQIEFTKRLLAKGFAYEVDGSVYFDLAKYEQAYPYGTLSGRKTEELQTGTRELAAQSAKRHPHDFTLWKKATPDHLMNWPSPWGLGFPGWHIECSAMSEKYLGTTFDIHGGGLDLTFPHHECEIAQGTAANGKLPARYWLHNNLVMIDGKKMGKSANNSISLQDCFQGRHALLSQPFLPMTLRFFILQAHYRSTLNFSNQAMKAAEKGYYKLIHGQLLLKALKQTYHAPQKVAHTPSAPLTEKINTHCQGCYEAMNEDFNTAKVLSHLFELKKIIQQLYLETDLRTTLTEKTFTLLATTYETFLVDILGFKTASTVDTEGLIEILVLLYKEAKEAKAYNKVSLIRDRLQKLGVLVQDNKTGVNWCYTSPTYD